ncbi:MAG: cobalamin-binding protein [Chloroflexi bacterium]|nr:cobalamin-binding protein [Chloroflexota bacterium]
MMIRKRILSALALILALGVASCAPAATPAPTATTAPTVAATIAPTTAPPTSAAVPPTTAPTPITITDVAGRKMKLAGIPQRIISLAPSNTEILFALDVGSKVVAVDDFSDYPAEAKALPKIGGSSGKYNFEQIVALKPDLILAAEITSPEAIQKLEDLKLAVAVISVTKTSFDSILNDITLAGQMTGQVEQAKRVTTEMKQKIDAIKSKVATAKTQPRVYWELDASDPAKPFTVGPGNFVNDLITLAGGVNVFGSTSEPYPQISIEQVVTVNPEMIILSDAAYGITVESVLKRSGWENIDAVKNKQVYPIDSNLTNRPGPRIVDGFEAVAKLIHPELFK